jgi:hypothetical protein
VLLEKRAQFAKAVRYPCYQRVHAPQVIILVLVKEGLELCVEQVEVLLDQNGFTRFGQAVKCGLVQVNLDPLLLLLQPLFCLQSQF